MFTRFHAVAARNIKTAAFTLGGLAIGSLLAIGCTANVDQDPTPVKVFKITPASGTFAAATPTSTAAASPATTVAGGETALQLTGQDTKFDKAELTAPSGAITIKFSNKDGGLIHNLHVYEGADARGTSAGQTELATGPIEQELKLNLTPGTYHYQCDAHPTTMKGTLTVN